MQLAFGVGPKFRIYDREVHGDDGAVAISSEEEAPLQKTHRRWRLGALLPKAGAEADLPVQEALLLPTYWALLTWRLLTGYCVEAPQRRVQSPCLGRVGDALPGHLRKR